MVDQIDQVDITGINSKNITLDPMGKLIEMKIELQPNPRPSKEN